ncbi:hypothetical protein EC957_006652 [Mortierella hygrophila]|uniref:Glutamine amidotransferase type-2 domain-containing protein n=1 Tax=Mortierella hygrophila TaxID=979708 RepID=A0A9P6FDP4_9FUNG|nr:hypothetical protein EC957_006652 [Mortierella hygrophila]
MNLIRLADKIKSPLVFAHVRASTAGSVSESNCHPWQYGRLMFMHNGNIANFHLIKRKVQESLPDEIYFNVNGNTDSEWAFAVFLSQLKTPLQAEPFCHQELQEAVVKTIAKLNAWIKDAANATTPTTPGSLGIAHDDGASMMNFAVTDGATVVCSRYISSRHLEAASLYYSSGNRFEKCNSSHYRMVKDNRRQDMVVIASEPLTFEKADWLTIPTNSVIVVTSKMNVLIYPVVDEYHNPISRGRGNVEQDIPVVVAELKGENRTDGARDTENREVEFVEGQVQRPTALSIEINIRNGDLAGFDSGSSAPSTPTSSSQPSSYIPSSPSASSMSLSTESLRLPAVPGYTKPSGEDSVDEEYNGSDPDHGHEADNDDDDDSDNEIEADYRIFPSKRRALSGLKSSSYPTARFGTPIASPVAAVTKVATSIERNSGRDRSSSSSVFLPL